MLLEWEGVERSLLRTQPNAAKRTRRARAGHARRQVQLPVQAPSTTSVRIGHRFWSRVTPRLARKGRCICDQLCIANQARCRRRGWRSVFGLYRIRQLVGGVGYRPKWRLCIGGERTARCRRGLFPSGAIESASTDVYYSKIDK